MVSLKPGGGSFGPGEPANFRGASFDGVGVAFERGFTLYLRYDNNETFTIGTGVKLAGFGEGGSRVFYTQGGNLKAFDVEDGVIDFTASATSPPSPWPPMGPLPTMSRRPPSPGRPQPRGRLAPSRQREPLRSLEAEVDFVARLRGRVEKAGSEEVGPGIVSPVARRGVPARARLTARPSYSNLGQT